MLKLQKQKKSITRKYFFIKKYLKEFFISKSVKYRSAKIDSKVAFSRKLIFCAFFAVMFFLILTMHDIIWDSINAYDEKTDTINLYANQVLTDTDRNNYATGWWNIEKSRGETEVSPNGSILEFSDSNSAFYSGGKNSIILGSFINQSVFSITKQSENITTAETANDSNSEQDVQVDSDALTEESGEAGISNEGGDNYIPTSSEEIKSGEINTNEIIEDSNQGEINENVEILNDNQNPETIEVISESGEISFLDKFYRKIKNVFINESLSHLFNTASAYAQEIFKIEKLDDLGEYKSAKINFSLALVEKNIINGFNSGEIINISTSTISEETGEYVNESVEQNIEEPALSEDSSLSEDAVVTPENTTEQSSDAPEQDVEINEDDSENIEANVVEPESDTKVETGTFENESGVSDQDGNVNIEEPATLGRIFKSLLDVKNVQAQNDDLDNAKIVIWYSLDAASSTANASSTDSWDSANGGKIWKKLDVLTENNITNAVNNGYLSFSAPFLEKWSDIENLQIKFEGLIPGQASFFFYLDSSWVEASYLPAKEVRKKDKRQKWEEALKILTDNLVFKASDKGEIKFQYQKNETEFLDNLGQVFGFDFYWKDVSLEADLVDSGGNIINKSLTIIFEENGEFTIKLPEATSKLKPGKYSIRFKITDSSGDEAEEIYISRDFVWGVTAINFNKSSYLYGDTAYFQMAVLDDNGHTICDANIDLEITTPTGKIISLVTPQETGFNIINTDQSSVISRNPECGPESITNTPDYYTHLKLDETGDYKVKMTAYTKEGARTIEDGFTVNERLQFDVERAGPTRIFPKANYNIAVSLKANENFKGDIIESVPFGFKIISQEIKLKDNNERDPFGSNYGYSEKDGELEKIIRWQDVELEAGDELEINYVFDAPDVSPEIYLLGPIQMIDNVTQSPVFEESRKWQIASDYVKKRAKTVSFIAGTYAGSGTSGNNSNSDNVFTSFQYRLAESDVTIKNAFIIFEAQYEAYTNNTGNYSGYTLSFDTCSGACTPTAFTGSGRAYKSDSTVLSYDSPEGNQVRLLLDVTNETQLAAYTGAGGELNGQVGYRVDRSASVNSIANAKAILVVTYTYNPSSVNLTNTVVFPLDSTNSTDLGSRQARLTGVCTKNSTCPVFDYKMDIPEFPGKATTTNRLSNWFQMYETNDGNTTGDITYNVNIQTYDQDSANYIHESALGGGQAHTPAMYFPNWTNSGYAENTSQKLEYYESTGNHDMIGGEVFETYMASSSKATKTRTVSFPIGIISNGQSTSLYGKSVNVYFPENGTATGTVKIKSAWFRIISNNYENANHTLTVSAKVGTDATGTSMVYNHNQNSTVIKTSFNLFYIVASTSYATLEKANSSTGVPVKINVQANNTVTGGVSAELMVTYTYTSEASGYLTNIKLFGGQSAVAPSTSTTTPTAKSVMPEDSGKQIRGASILSSYLNSDTGAAGIPGSTVFRLDTNLSTGNPTCSVSYYSRSGSVTGALVNDYTEMYDDVTSAMNTTDGQSYNACYADNDTGVLTTDGAKMNGILSYTYQWDNTAPTSTIISKTIRRDGSGTVDMTVRVGDADKDDARAKLEYATGTTCSFVSPSQATLDTSDSNTTATYGDPSVSNINAYQIGTSSAPITTASGTNTINFDWLAGSNLKNIEGTYCLRLTANDFLLSQVTPATSTVYIDTKKPTAPTALSLNKRTGASITLNFGATSTETNFKEYKIFYKIYDGTPPTESSSLFGSTSDSNLANKLFNGKSTTTISGLTQKTTYSFAIWAYDQYGNKASSSMVSIYTNDRPTGVFNSLAQKTNGSGVVDLSIEVDDANDDDANRAKLEYVSGASCNFSTPLIPSISTEDDSTTADYGDPEIDNANNYQIGTTSGYVITSGGSNTVQFDWLTMPYLSTADGTYCLRLTVYDGFDTQLQSATGTVVVDNVNPTTPGSLTAGKTTTDSITLIFATTTPATDGHEPTVNAYKIFYKQGTSGVTENNTEKDSVALNAYNFNGATSTVVTGLNSNTWYVFNIWAYDIYGNKVSATEVAIKTKATISNDSFTLTNGETEGASTNIVVAGNGSEANFRVVVSETNGWMTIASTSLRLADSSDNSSPFTDLVFYWNSSNNTFYEIGNDALNAASISGNSTSNCSGYVCTLDFKIIFNKTFSTFSTNYNAEVYSINDSGVSDSTSYPNLYQVRRAIISQNHYRWRNDDGAE